MILSLNFIFCSRMTVKTEFIRNNIFDLYLLGVQSLHCHLIGLLAAKRYFIRFGLKHIPRTRR